MKQNKKMRLGIILLLLVTIIVGVAGHIAVRRRNAENGAYLSAIFANGSPCENDFYI